MKSSDILQHGLLSSDGDMLTDPMAWASMRKLSNDFLFHNTLADASHLSAALAGQTGALADAFRAEIGDRSDGFVVPTHTSSGTATGAPKPEEQGSGDPTVAVAASGNPLIDGILAGIRWSDGSITYSDPDSVSDYQAGHPEAFTGFHQMSAQQMIAVHFALNAANYTQPIGAAGFAVEGFTNLDITYAGTGLGTGTIRVCNTTDPGTAYAYYPSTAVSGGDAFFGPSGAAPIAGNYDWHTVIHELGHTLGLKHGHDTGVYGALPADHDSLEFSVMTYRTFIGDDTSGYKYEQWGAPQTFMMLDIAALQYMYGANFSINSGDTVYTWDQSTGQSFVNGSVAIAPGGNRIFSTIWDGGGVDTYDLSNYTTNLNVDLNPGGFSVFSSAQLAYLGGGPNGGYARGNVFNALLYNGDSRSYIENANGGSGNDIIQGNAVDNVLNGNGGADTLNGNGGNDTVNGGDGNDVLTGGVGIDVVNGGAGDDWIEGGFSKDTVDGGTGNDTFYVRDGEFGDDTTGGAGIDTLDLSNYTSRGSSVNLAATTYDFVASFGGPYLITGVENVNGTQLADTIIGDGAANVLNGNDGDDNLDGGDGNDVANGGNGNDTVSGGNGDDTLAGESGDDTVNGGDGNDTLTGSFGVDTINGGAGNDWIEGGFSKDTVNGGDGNDTFFVRDGEFGDDTTGGTGIDTLDLSDYTSRGATVSLASSTYDFNPSFGGPYILAGVENVNGTQVADTIIGDGASNVLNGNGGNDLIQGGLGADTINGGAGIDIASYSDSAAAVTVNLATGTGVGGSAQGDTLTGIENVNGSNQSDLLIGNSGVNVLRGLNGNDVLQGGLGADTLNGEGGTDTASYSDSAAAVTVNLAAGTGLGGTAQGDTLLAIENANGSNQSDLLIGSSGANVLRGLNGNDVLQGGLGADTLNGEGGIDTASYTDSAAAVTVNLAAGTGAGGTAAGDTLLTIENVNGSSFNDTLTGDAGANVLRGMNGKDTLTGGAGADHYYYGTLAESVTGANADRITDFSHAQADRIDLSAIDANSGVAGNQAFTFIGTGAYTNVAGQLHYSISGGVTVIGGDVNGDGVSDFNITLTGGIALVAADFVL